MSLDEHKKEGHLYFVSEDRGNIVYLWDFTEKTNKEFKEEITSEALLAVAKEGAMLIYQNGRFELYSEDGYDMIANQITNQ